MKRGELVLSFMILFSFVLILNTNAATLNSCSIKSSCSSGEITMASVADTRDAHISKDITKFPFKLCCVGTAISNSCEVASTNRDNIADIYLLDDSHIDPGPQTNSICLSTTDNSNVQCRVSNNCEINEACVLSLYQGEDSHVADCSVSLANKICCSTALVKTCYAHGEAKADSGPLQCCATATDGRELYYSKEGSTDITGGCCVKVIEVWDSFNTICVETFAPLCGSQCPYTPSQSQYFTTQGCFYDSPPPLPYELSCCQATQFGVTDKFQTGISVVRNTVNECTGAQFCGNTVKQCSSTPDGFCPQNYGDWSTCKPNELGGGCSICDPDCGTCGSVRFSQFKDPASQNEQLTIKVEYSAPIQQSITLWRVNPSATSTSSDSYVNTVNCIVQGSACAATFSPNPINVQYLTTPSRAGAPYTFKSYLAVNPDIIIQKTGHTVPNVEILNPSNNARLQGITSIQAKAQSDSNINNIKWYIEKRDNPGTPVTFSPVNVRNNQGACTFCNANDCNLLGSTAYPLSQDNRNVVAAKDFDTLRCDNNDFKIKVVAEDQGGNKAEKSILVSTVNSNAPCTDNCPVFDSRVLKIILAKVKTWV